MKKIFLIVLIFRLLISFLPPMSIDMGAWMAWSSRMVAVGPQNFYSQDIFTANPPGYLYIFWLIGELGKSGSQWFLKLPANLFDLGTGLLIYRILVEKKLGRLGILGFLGYTLNPAIVFNSSVFGQFDGVGAFFSLLTVYLLLEKKNFFLAGLSFAAAWAVKPQAIALAPAVGIIAFYEGFSRWNLAKARFHLLKLGVGFLGTTLLLYWPFFPSNPLGGIWYVFQTMNNVYSCTTCFAFNFWGLWGNWGNDQALFAGIPLMWWGIGLTIVSVGIIFLPSLRGALATKQSHRKNGGIAASVASLLPRNDGRIYLAISLSILVFNMFVTRMHERYVLPFFAFFLIAALLINSRKLICFYIFFSFFHLLNVYYPYASYNPQYGLTPDLVLWMGEHFRFLSMIGFGSFLLLFWWYLSGGFKGRSLKGTPYETYDAGPVTRSSRFNRDPLRSRHPLELPWSRNEILLVTLLIFVSFLIRVIRLDIPKTYYFDEVYHAFTAVEMSKGNKMAWEWWNTPPQGFAYEWTHPPLAKEIMAFSIKIFGEKPFAWRLPGVVLGSGVILLIYLLGRNLFNKRAAFLAAFLASCDGLLFTQSRIGMNDIYFLFFMLLAFYLFSLKRGGLSWLLMGISLGLALASKWTAIYGIGILAGLYFFFSLTRLHPARLKAFLLSIFWFLLIPLAVYLLTYIPFFQSGHTWAQFDELQHQMWWYHTGLKATHPFQSLWYTWPFDLRPVWYFVEYGQGTVANIYDLGNPVVFWGGILAIGYILFSFVRTFIFAGREFLIFNLKFQIVLVLSGYFGFFLPWAVSPRIMFLYHYLPSVPFLCLALGWGLDRIGGIRVIGEIGGIRIAGKVLTFAFLLLTLIVFVYFYPHWSALPVPKWWSDQYFWLSSWR